MIVLSQGKITAAFPAPGAQTFQGRVYKIQVSPDPTATGYTYIKQGLNTVRAFNKPGATGSMDVSEYFEAANTDDGIDPTQFSISQSVAGEGCFVTYFAL